MPYLTAYGAQKIKYYNKPGKEKIHTHTKDSHLNPQGSLDN